MSLLRSLFGRPDSSFVFGGSTYPTGLTQTLGEAKQELADGTFDSFIRHLYQENGVVFACMLARQALFSEARFKYRRLEDGQPGDLFDGDALRYPRESLARRHDRRPADTHARHGRPVRQCLRRAAWTGWNSYAPTGSDILGGWDETGIEDLRVPPHGRAMKVAHRGPPAFGGRPFRPHPRPEVSLPGHELADAGHPRGSRR